MFVIRDGMVGGNSLGLIGLDRKFFFLSLTDVKISTSYLNEMKPEVESESEEEKEDEGRPMLEEGFPSNKEEPSSVEREAVGVVPPHSLAFGVEERNGTPNDIDHVTLTQGRRTNADPGTGNPGVPSLAVDTLQTVQSNKSLLLLCYKEVKRPGRGKHEKTFNRLECSGWVN